MKKRTKITLRTKIYLAIAGLSVAVSGILYAANPFPFSTGAPIFPGFPSDFYPTGVSASPDLLLVTPFCTEDALSIDCNGLATVFATFPGFGSCREKYMAVAPSMSANAGFTPRDVFATEGRLIFKVSSGAVTLFADLGPSCTASDHNGISFDHFGTYGNDMIVTCQEGVIFRVNGAGTVTHIATLFPPDPATHAVEGPAVVPPLFGPHGGKIWVADETANAIHAVGLPPTYTVTLNILSHVSAEGVYVIPNPPCANCGNSFYNAEQQQFRLVWAYPASDFLGLGGNVILVSESGGDNADTSLVTTDGTNYFQTSFGPRPPGVDEGSSMVDCNVPTATPTTTPTATSTPTATFTPTATATFTPTATATFTPTATATFTPTATATFTPTATATFTPTATATSTPTPTPTPPGNVSKITPTGTTCNEFKNGTAETLLNLNYSVSGGKISQNVTPGVFFYWVMVTVPTAGNNVFTVTESITTGNFSTPFLLGGGSNVFDLNCNSVSETITQNAMTGTVTVTFNAPTAGTYIISLKYNSKSIAGAPAPSPTTTVHYDFATTGVPGSTSGLDLIKN